jgi:hypothetical protein
MLHYAPPDPPTWPKRLAAATLLLGVVVTIAWIGIVVMLAWRLVGLAS